MNIENQSASIHPAPTVCSLSTVKIPASPCMLTTGMRNTGIQLGNKMAHRNVLNCSGIGQALRSKGKEGFKKVG